MYAFLSFVMHFIYIFGCLLFFCSLICSIDRHTQNKRFAMFFFYSHFIQTPATLYARACVVRECVREYLFFLYWNILLGHGFKLSFLAANTPCPMFLFWHTRNIKNKINWRNKKKKKMSHTQSSFVYTQTHLLWRISWSCLVLILVVSLIKNKKENNNKNSSKNS